MADPLGVSTGQGRGFAQDFGDTYNPYFKEETVKKEAKIAKADKTISDALGTISTKDLWNKDIPILNEQKKVINKWVGDNYRDILRGDLNALTEFQDQVDSISNTVASSKYARDQFYQKIKPVLDNPELYEDGVLEQIEMYGKDPGKWDIENLFLDKKFDQIDFEKSLATSVNALVTDPTPLKLESTNEAGDKIYTSTERTSNEAMDQLALKLWENTPNIRKSYSDLEALKKDVYKYRDNKMSSQVKSPYSGNSGDDNEYEVDFIQGVTPFTVQQNVAFGDVTSKIDVETASTVSSTDLDGVYGSFVFNLDIADGVKNRGFKITDSALATASYDEETGTYNQGDAGSNSDIDARISEIGSKPFKISQIKDVYELDQNIYEKDGTTIKIPKGTILSAKDMDRGKVTVGKGKDQREVDITKMVKRQFYALGSVNENIGGKENFQMMIPYDIYEKIYGTKVTGKTAEAHKKINKQIKNKGLLSNGGLSSWDYYQKTKNQDNESLKKMDNQTTKQTELPKQIVLPNKTVLKPGSKIVINDKLSYSYEELLTKLKSNNVDINDPNKVSAMIDYMKTL